MDHEYAFMILFAVSMPAGFTLLVAFAIVRQVGRQRIAENLLRERLARAWGRARPAQEAQPAGD